MPDTDLVRAFTFANAHERTKAYPAPAAVAPVTWFKRLPGAPLLPLPRKLPAPDSPAQDWLSRVAVLCSYTTGILRRELHAPYVYHRGIPSPRTLHPTELYIWVPAGANGEPGLYHYLPLQHALEQVRSAECDASVRAALGAESAGVDLAVFVASDFWRVAHLYGDFALRLTALEAGQAVENLALLGHELGWVSRVQGFFDEAALGECLGLELEAEGILAAVCFAASGDRADHPVTAPVAAPPIAPLRQRWQHTSGVPLSESCAQLRAMQRQAAAVKAPARRHNTESEVADALRAVAAPTAEALPLPAAPPGQRPDLRTLIQRRHSGNEYEGLLGRPDPISLATMGEILRQTPGPWAGSDLAGVIPDPYIVVAPIHVEGIAPGFYRYRAGHHELIPVYRGPEAEALLTRKIVHTNGIRVDSLAFCAFVVTPTDQALAAAGARAYRLLHLRAGAAAQRAGLAAAAHDLFCRPNLTYLPVLAEQLLGLSGSDHTVIHQLLFGRNHYRGWRFDLSL